MAVHSKGPISTHGRGIEVTTTSPLDGSDTTIYTATAGTTDDDCDWITLWATNDSTSPIELVLGWGDDDDPDDQIAQTIPARAGKTLLCLNQPLRNGLVVRASAAATGIVIWGEVLKVRPDP